MDKLLEVKNLKTSFFTHAGEVKAVRGVNFNLARGKTMGIVGESGCGKSVTMLSLMGLLPDAGKVIDGEIWFDGKDILKHSEKQMEKIRGNEIGMIFQDPMTSLNPVFSVGVQMTEHLIKHKNMSRRKAYKKAIEMLNLVGIPDPGERMKQYPHEFSGGMRQRVMIASTLATYPKLIIADEPTTALDVTIQAQILELMKQLKDEFDTSIILITHDLGVVADVCDNINVMYGGLIMETGKVEDIYYNPQHPYTWGLLNSIPNPKTLTKQRLIPIDGQPPDLIQPPIGCPFVQRCKYAMEICDVQHPDYTQINSEHKVACWLQHPKAPKKDYRKEYTSLNIDEKSKQSLIREGKNNE